jgi:nucleoside-diphosphate-sugar epimerase
MLIGITGGTGFIGRRVVLRHLELGDRVRVLSRRTRTDLEGFGPVEIIQGDLGGARERLPEFVNGLDVLYHCAAELFDEPRMQAVHVDGTQALLDAAGGYPGRWVQLSSVGVYGRQRTGVVTEDTVQVPRGRYEVTKKESDDLVLAAAARGAIRSLTILRPSMVIGTGMRSRLLSKMIGMIERRLFFFIGRPGSSVNCVDVTNVVDALMLCASHPGAHGRIYNLSDWCALEDFVQAICNGVGTSMPRLRLPEGPVRFVNRAIGYVPLMPVMPLRVDAFVNRSRYAIDRIESELGYAHRVSVIEGLRDLIPARMAS